MSQTKSKQKKIAFVLTGTSLVRGAEIRFVNSFKYLKTQEDASEYFLVISAPKLRSLVHHGILDTHQPGMILTCPRFWFNLLYSSEARYKPKKGNFNILLLIITRTKRWISLFYNTLFLLIFIAWKKIKIIHPITEGSPPCGIVKYINPAVGLVSSYITVDPSFHKKGIWYLFSSQYLALKLSDAIDVLGDTYMKKLQGLQVPFSLEKITISPCSFTLPFDHNPAEKKERIVTFCGNFSSQKNPLLFLEAIQILIKTGNLDIRFKLIGNGPLEKDIQRFLKENHLNPYVDVNYSHHPEKILAQSMIFCSLQDEDNYPSQVLLQAMYAQNAVIATDFGCTQKLVLHGKTGLLIKKDSSLLAKEIMYMLNNPEHRIKMAEEASILVQQQHNIQKFSKYLNFIYDSI